MKRLALTALAVASVAACGTESAPSESTTLPPPVTPSFGFSESTSRPMSPGTFTPVFLKADVKLLQIVSVKSDLIPLTVAEDGTKPVNSRFVVAHVSLTPSDTPNDPTAMPGSIRTEGFFMVDGSGKRYPVWNGNSPHAVPKEGDRLHATASNPRDQAEGHIAFDVPQGELKLGYTLTRAVIYWTPFP